MFAFEEAKVILGIFQTKPGLFISLRVVREYDINLASYHQRGHTSETLSFAAGSYQAPSCPSIPHGLHSSSPMLILSSPDHRLRA
jgi:hypothetical protein